MSKRLYVAYGSNLNIRQMKYRCPTAKLYGVGTIEDYELQFKGQPNGAFATIAPKEGTSVSNEQVKIRHCSVIDFCDVLIKFLFSCVK